MSVVDVQDVDRLHLIHEIPLVAIALMGVEVDDHGLLDAPLGKEESEGNGDVGVGTEAPSPLAGAVVEAAPDIDSPTPFQRQLSSLQ